MKFFITLVAAAGFASAATTTAACTKQSLAQSALNTLKTQLTLLGGLVPCAVQCFSAVGINVSTVTVQNIIDSCNPDNDTIFKACLSLCPSSESLDSFVVLKLSQVETNCKAIEAAIC
ncbi:hypothetical protein HDU84_002384 [Entophlyctis sp. JEL0112]|nr:hypothetical protein HDU84_002384 [Entophlyctis sp. JEL0112]